MDRMFTTLWCLGSIAAFAAAQEATPPPAVADVRIVGKVVTWDGRPVAEAAVTCTPDRTTDTNELLRDGKTTTDAEGRYVLTVAPPRQKDAARAVLHVAAKGMAAVAQLVPWKRKAAKAAAADGGFDDFTVVDADPVEPPDAAGKTIEYEPETPVEDIVLTAGQRLFGRVRDESGKPLAGVRVVATDMLEHGNLFRSGMSFGFHCAALSEASGIFSLPGALPLGARLEFSLDGCFREVLQPVAAGAPLEVTMHPSGWIQGRVLDKDGRSVADANVTVNYELRTPLRTIRTGADGSFRTGLERPGRWRIQAQKSAGGTAHEGHSAVMTGPRENLELLVDAKTAAERHQSLTVRAVVKKTGEAIAVFQAGAVWEEYANQNNAYLDYRLRVQLHDAPKAKDGAATVHGPGPHGTPTGVIRVIAAGYAPATRKDVEWKEPEGNQPPEPITLELEPEATIAGTLRDERTGQPVVGAKVFARVHTDPNQGRYDDGGNPSDAATSGADGSFRLAGLGEGTYEVLVRDAKRPNAPPTEVELAAAEQRTGLLISLPSGAEVTGKLDGTAIGHGWRVFLSRLPRQTFGEMNYYANHFGGQQQEVDRGVPVAADGSFRIEGVALDNHLLVMRLPSPPRLGGDLFLPIEPFRVRAAGVQRQFDCSEDQPGKIHGRISFPHAAVPFEQIVVVSRLVPEEDGQVFFSPFDTNYAGTRSFVAADGAFALRVGPGTYQLQVVDLASGVLLHMEEKKLQVKTGGAVERDLQLDLARIELQLKPAADTKVMAMVERIELRIVPKAMKALAAQFAGNDNYDTGGGLLWPIGQTKVEVVLPLGDATLLCRNNIAGLRIDEERWNNAPLGRAEFEVTNGADAKTTCEIEVGGPPEIPDPEKDKDKKDEKGQDAAPVQVEIRDGNR